MTGDQCTCKACNDDPSAGAAIIGRELLKAINGQKFDYQLLEKHARLCLSPLTAPSAGAVSDELVEAAIYHRMAEVLHGKTMLATSKPTAIATIEAYLHDAGRRGMTEAANIIDTLTRERDDWESFARELEAELERKTEALRPFAKAGELFAPRDADSYDQCIYSPAAGEEYYLTGDHLRQARAALSPPASGDAS
jgi:hypothetical protein